MKAIFVEIEKCLACKSCELACAVQHASSHSIHTAIWEEPLPVRRISVEHTSYGPLPLQCRHCEEAPCVEACIAGAIRKNSTTGVVTIDEQRCIGCWTCIMVCPFGAVASSGKREVAYKCDGCEESEEMACVEACPTGALLYCEPVELVGLKRRERAKREPMVTEARTGRLLRLGK